ncbi:MAG: hypothetical protein Kilf2KO_01310 [Rhodospirillales bacterium]
MSHRLPSLNGLRAFEAAARHLSFRLAAAELGVTAGAVSQQVKKLEAALGIALFRRLPQSLLLTREGEAYHPKVAQAFEALTEATEAIAPDLNSKKFSLGLCPKGAALLPEGWPRHSPSLRGFVRDTRITDDLELLLDNELDCMVRQGSGLPVGVTAIAVVAGASAAGAESLQFVCRNGLIACRQSQAIIADLKTHLN